MKSNLIELCLNEQRDWGPPRHCKGCHSNYSVHILLSAREAVICDTNNIFYIICLSACLYNQRQAERQIIKNILFVLQITGSLVSCILLLNMVSLRWLKYTSIIDTSIW